MSKPKPSVKRLYLWLALLFAIAVAGFIGLRLAAGVLRDQVQQALGPEAEIGAIELGLSRVVVRDLRLPAPQGWPSTDTLRAQRVVLEPDLRTLLSDRYRVAAVHVEGAYLSVWRTREGRVRLLPSLLEDRVLTPRTADTTAPQIEIGAIRFENATLEFFDSSVRQPAHRLSLEQVQVEVGELQIPGLENRTTLVLQGEVAGPAGPGPFEINGWIQLANGDSEFSTQLRNIDLSTLEPYLIQSSETGVRKGTLDLDLKSTVQNRQLTAPGRLVLADLELAPADRPLATFMGMPRSAVIQALKNRERRIELDFTLEGDLDNPTFSLNEVLAVRLAVGVARTLGLSLEGIVRGIGGFGEKSLDAAGSAIRGVGDWLTGDDEEASPPE